MVQKCLGPKQSPNRIAVKMNNRSATGHPTARGELGRAEGFLVDDHIDGEDPTFAFDCGSTGEPAFRNHENHGRAGTEDQGERYPAARIY
jgi:hypothetical protein